MRPYRRPRDWHYYVARLQDRQWRAASYLGFFVEGFLDAGPVPLERRHAERYLRRLKRLERLYDLAKREQVTT